MQSDTSLKKVSVTEFDMGVESALRLIGALLDEQNEVWQERKYLDMDEFNEWLLARKSTVEDAKVIAIKN